MKRTTPKVSVVIPAYNEEEYIAICLDALQAQTSVPLEIIVVDNNSTDKTMAIVKKYAGVQILKEKKQGIVHARNRGFDVAKGEIIARLDAESKPKADWIEHIEKVLKTKSIAAVTGPFYYYDMPLSKATISWRGEWTIRSAVKAMIHNFQYLSGANMAIKRSVWEQIRSGLCDDEGYHEDIDIALHLTAHGYKIRYDEDMVVGTSARRIDDPPKRFYTYLQRFVRTYREHHLPPAAGYVPVALYMSFYPGLKLIRFFYDSEKSKFSLDKLKAELERLMSSVNGGKP